MFTKSPAKAFHADKPDAFDFHCSSIEDGDAVTGQNVRDFLVLTTFEFVITHHSKDRNAPHFAQILNQLPGFFRLSIIGQIATEQQHVGVFCNFMEQGLEFLTGCAGTV
jgi:hypothetical protein